MKGNPQIVVRTPPTEVAMLEELRQFFGMSNSRLVRKLIRDAHARLPKSQAITPARPNKLAAQIEARQKGEKRSGLVRPEPPACRRHVWENMDGVMTCMECGARKA